jgi:hypothetical protein
MLGEIIGGVIGLALCYPLMWAGYSLYLWWWRHDQFSRYYADTPGWKEE